MQTGPFELLSRITLDQLLDLELLAKRAQNGPYCSADRRLLEILLPGLGP